MQQFPSYSIKKTLAFALQNKRSPFYRNLYKKHGISLRSVKDISDFRSLPFLTREDIMFVSPMGRLFVPKEKVTQWNMTSGTTGKPLIVPKIDHGTEDEMNDVMARILKEKKIGNVMLLGNLHRMNSISREWIYHPKLSKIPIIFGDIGDLATAARLFAAAEVEGITTTPSALHFFLPYLKEVYNPARVKFISLGGEVTSQQRLRLFRSHFPNAYFHFRFGGTESPVCKGFQCKFLSKFPPRYLHPDTGFFLYEVVDEKGNLVGDGKVGELALTTLKKCAFPLIRYKTGDALVWAKKKCGCGRPYVMELFGRMGYDFVRAFGVTIHGQILEDAIASIKEAEIEDYQLHVHEIVFKNRLMPKLILEVSGLKEGKTHLAALKKGIEDHLYLSSNLTLSDLIKKELFLPLEIKTVSKFPVTSKKLKIVSHLR